MSLIACKCGCGGTLPSVDSRGRPRQYLNGHFNRKVRKNVPCACGCGTMIETTDNGKRFVHGHNGAGRLHYDYKGGKYINDAGYVMVLRPKHPRASSNGYVREHILVMEAYLGRPLKSNENVHHINKNRADNRIENLKKFDSMADHMAEHFGTTDLGEKICSNCGSDKTHKKGGRHKGYRWHINKEKKGWLCNNCYKHRRRENTDGTTAAKFVN